MQNQKKDKPVRSIIRNGRKENGVHRSSFGATNGKCNNCNDYAHNCFCSKTNQE